MVRTLSAAILFVSLICVNPRSSAGQDYPRDLRSSAAEAQADPLPIARAVQARYDRVRDFSADFTHTYAGGVLKKRVVEQGTVQVKKPGRMRWQYRSPEEKLFVSDGVQIYSYVPADKQVIVSPMPAADEATTAVLFLTGKGDLARDFTPTLATAPAGSPAGSVALALSPKRDQRDYDTLTLVVDPTTYAIRMLIAADRQGGMSTFAFTNVKENGGLADKIFGFTIPRGADVIRTGQD
jgi:outer membrane lipoprotein carrier protein